MDKKAQLPGWAYVVALIIGFFLLFFIIWLFTKSGYSIVDTLRGFI